MVEYRPMLDKIRRLVEQLDAEESPHDAAEIAEELGREAGELATALACWAAVRGERNRCRDTVLHSEEAMPDEAVRWILSAIEGGWTPGPPPVASQDEGPDHYQAPYSEDLEVEVKSGSLSDRRLLDALARGYQVRLLVHSRALRPEPGKTSRVAYVARVVSGVEDRIVAPPPVPKKWITIGDDRIR